MATKELTPETVKHSEQAAASPSRAPEHEQLAHFFQLSLDMLCIASTDGYFKQLNPAFTETLGWSEAELLDQPFISFVHPDDVERTEAEIERLGRGEITVQFENRFQTRDGAYKWLVWNAHPSPEGNLYAVARDITSQREAEKALAKQAAGLETVSLVSTTAAASSLHNPDQLLQDVADLTKNNFDLYHAHIYLYDENKETLVLKVGAGEVGVKMVAEGHAIPLARQQSLVARAARTRQGVIVNDVEADSGFLYNPLLPETKSEMAVPMIVGDRLLGVLDVQSDEADRFSAVDVKIKTTLAAQIAVALQNARTYTETEKARQAMDEMTRRLTREGWQKYLEQRQANLAFGYDLESVMAVGDGREDTKLQSPSLLKSLATRGESIGEIMIEAPNKLVEDANAIIDAVAERLSAHIENLRLTEETQRSLLLTESLYTASNQINIYSADLQETIAAIAEAGPVKAVNRIVLFLFERDPEGNLTAAVIAGNWHSGQGPKPTPVGTRYEREQMKALGLFSQGHIAIYNDVQNDPEVDPFTQNVLKKLEVRSLAGIPLLVGDHQIGNFLLETEQRHHFTEADLEPYIALAGQLAVALDRQRLLQEAQRRAERERMVRTITDKIRRGADQETILRVARQELSQILGASRSIAQLGTQQQLLQKHQQANGAASEDSS